MAEYTKGKYSWQFDPLFPDKPVEITCNGVIIATSSLGNAQKLVNALNAGEDMYEALKLADKFLEALFQQFPKLKLDRDYRVIMLRTNIEQALAKAEGKE